MAFNNNDNNQYPQENTGVLFPKENLTGNPKAPAYTGHFTDINGKKWQLAAWVKVARNSGEEFLTVKASEFKEKTFSRHEDQGNKPTRTLPPVYVPKQHPPAKFALDQNEDDINF